MRAHTINLHRPARTAHGSSHRRWVFRRGSMTRGFEQQGRQDTQRVSGQPRDPAVGKQTRIEQLQVASGTAPVVQRSLANNTTFLDEEPQTDAHSARFEGDRPLAEVAAKKRLLRKGSKGLQVTKLQQALVDAGFLLPLHGVDGDFGAETEKAVIAFQTQAK